MLSYNRQAMSASVSSHGKSLLLGLVLLGATTAFLARQQVEIVREPASMVVEHVGNTSAAVVITSKSGSLLVDVSLKSGTGVSVSVPAYWRLTQAKGVPMAEISMGENELGFRRFTSPRDVTLTFLSAVLLSDLTVINPPQKPLNVSVQRIDLETGNVRSSSKLFTDPQVVFP